MVTELHKLAKAMITDALEIYTERYWCEEEKRVKPRPSTPQEKAEVWRWIFPSTLPTGMEVGLPFEDACDHSKNDAARIRILMKRMRNERAEASLLTTCEQ